MVGTIVIRGDCLIIDITIDKRNDFWRRRASLS